MKSAAPAQKKASWIAEQVVRGDTALRQLLSAKRTATSEYDERIRKIRGFMEALFVKRSDPQQLELFKEGELLSPEIDELISNPLRGLT